MLQFFIFFVDDILALLIHLQESIELRNAAGRAEQILRIVFPVRSTSMVV